MIVKFEFLGWMHCVLVGARIQVREFGAQCSLNLFVLQ